MIQEYISQDDQLKPCNSKAIETEKTGRNAKNEVATPVLGLQPRIGNRAVQRLSSQHNNTTTPISKIQRVVEVRPPGRGEASAFDRRQELIDRMNRQSPAMRYRLGGKAVRYDVIDGAALMNFDHQMRGFLDRDKVVPIRLITSAGRVGGGPLLADSLQEAYVDLDDMLASDDRTFRLELIHFLTERSSVRNYERRIGTGMGTEFPRAHRAGRESEVAVLQDVIGDPTIQFIYNERRPNGTWVVGFRSAERYWVFKVFRRTRQVQTGGQVFVRTRDGRRLTIEELRAERAVAAPLAAAPAPALP